MNENKTNTRWNRDCCCYGRIETEFKEEFVEVEKLQKMFIFLH